MSSDKWVKARLSWARRSHLELFQKLAKTVERLDAIVRRMLADTSHNSAFSISAECEHLWTDVPPNLSSRGTWSPIPNGRRLDVKKRFSEEQIIGFLREAESGLPVAELCRRHDFSEASYDLWRSKFGGMTVSDAKRLKELETENARLKRLLADAMLENEVTKEALRKKW